MRVRPIVLLGALGVASTALAESGGVSDYSGKAQRTCTSCHYGGSAPTVTLTGPTTVPAGSTNTYQLTIQGGAAKVGGLNVAVDTTAAVLVPGVGTQLRGEELVHRGPKAFSGGAVSWEFSLRAPAQEGTVKLYASGNSANGDTDWGGDLSASTQLAVTVSSAGPADGGAADGGPADGGGPTDGEPAGEPSDGGCTAAGGALVPLALLGVASALRSRRR